MQGISNKELLECILLLMASKESLQLPHRLVIAHIQLFKHVSLRQLYLAISQLFTNPVYRLLVPELAQSIVNHVLSQLFHLVCASLTCINPSLLARKYQDRNVYYTYSGTSVSLRGATYPQSYNTIHMPADPPHQHTDCPLNLASNLRA
jgi:hypothetical protein